MTVTKAEGVNDAARDFYLAYKSGNINRDQFLSAIFAVSKQGLGIFIRHRLRMKSREDHDDVFQETMTRFMKTGPDLTAVPLLPWLFTVARRIVIDQKRKNRRQSESGQYALNGIPKAITGEEEQRLLLKRGIETAFDTLPKKWSHVAYLHFIVGRTQIEIATDLAEPSSKIGYYIGKSRQHLRKNALLSELMAALRSRKGKA